LLETCGLLLFRLFAFSLIRMIELAPNHKYGLPLPAPVMPAAGVFGYGDEYRDLVDYTCLGALVTNPVSLHPRRAAHPPRIAAHREHLIVHTGLANPGLRAVLREHRASWERLPIPVIVHLIATTPAETAALCEQLSGARGVGGVELGLSEGVAARQAVALLEAAREGDLPVIVRVPFSRVETLALPLAQAGADAFTLTAPPRAVLPAGLSSDAPDTRLYMRGRLYSTAAFPQLLNVLARWARRLDVPVIACGGVTSVEDALACLELGAAAIQVDALLWRDPALIERVARGLAAPVVPAL